MKNNEPAEVHAKPSSGTYPSPAPQTQNQGQHERFPGGQGSQIGCGLISILITSTDFADKATVEKKHRLWIRALPSRVHNTPIRDSCFN